RRGLKFDLAVSTLLLAGLLVALSVFSYDPADPPGTSVYPVNLSPRNLLGPPGAWLASTLHDAFGIAVYVLLCTWFVLVMLLFVRRRRLTWLLRFAGWVLLLPSIAVIGDAAAQDLVSGPVTGAGGSVGAWLSSWLKARFQPLG